MKNPIVASAIFAACLTMSACSDAEKQQHVAIISDTQCQIVTYPGGVETTTPGACKLTGSFLESITLPTCGLVQFAPVTGSIDTVTTIPPISPVPDTCPIKVDSTAVFRVEDRR